MEDVLEGNALLFSIVICVYYSLKRKNANDSSKSIKFRWKMEFDVLVNVRVKIWKRNVSKNIIEKWKMKILSLSFPYTNILTKMHSIQINNYSRIYSTETRIRCINFTLHYATYITYNKQLYMKRHFINIYNFHGSCVIDTTKNILEA